ncbi:type III-B CRISPR module RAMP protein Cmr6 [Acididesulfobacillus acetoxydans]|nr:type III-B CRISPR module RAMP protein Cmr6 [Acididesulfobacillus acetoxydans]
MNRKRLRIFQFSCERGKGIILGEDGKKYSFDLASENNQLKNQLALGAEVEFTVIREGNPSQVNAVSLCREERTPVHEYKRNEKGIPPLRPQAAAQGGPRRGDAEMRAGAGNWNMNGTQGRREGGGYFPAEREVPRYIPRDTRELLAESEVKFENYYLRLNKFPLVQNGRKGGAEKERFVVVQHDQRGLLSGTLAPEFSFCRLPEILARREKSILDLGFETLSFTAKPEWRVVVGLGGASVYETSITLHHLYGFPYLPGSAVKGVTRSWIWAEHFAEREGREQEEPGWQDESAQEESGGEKSGQEEARPCKAGQDEGFIRLFGGKTEDKKEIRKGSVLFFDAFPLGNPEIEVDVMTPHNADYYGSKNKAPADYYEPNPILFLTVGKKTEFRFTLAIRKEDNVEIKSGCFAGKRVLEVARTGLEQALKEQGIGAKTAVGYGFMS